MKLTLTLSSPKGYYSSKTIKIDNIRNGLNNVMSILDTMPDESDGVKIYDWNKCVIKIERN